MLLSDLVVQFPGGGTSEDTGRRPPERPQDYPEQFYFGILPAAGIFLRHVSSAEFRNVDFTFTEPDARPAVVYDDVRKVIVIEADE